MGANSRKVILINPRFQWRFIFFSLVIASFQVAVLFGATALFFTKCIEQGKLAGLPANNVYYQLLREQNDLMNWILFGAASISFIAIIVLGIVFSHRIAGPIYRLLEHMRNMEKGEATGDLVFRENDFFPELADTFNAVIKYVRKNSADKSDKKVS